MAQAVKRESGLSGGGPVSIATATGDDLRIFSWLNWAARDITLSRPGWRFRRGTATLPSTILQANPASSFGLTDFASWKQESIKYKPSGYRVSDGAGMERSLTWMPYDDFRQQFLVGAQTAGSAQYWSVSPSEEFLIGPTPDSAHFIRADYVKDHTDMVTNDAVSIIPSSFHMLIVWRALMEYAGYDAASEVYQRAEKNYSPSMVQLIQNQMEPIGYAARSLA
jgi:hypothetical protein